MHRFGVFLVWTGLLLTVAGLVSGFGLLFAGRHDIAMLWMSAVPFGFVVLFAGLVATQLDRPSSRR